MTQTDLISFFSEDISFNLEDEQLTQNWINKTITREGKYLGPVSYIFCSDNYLLRINQDYLEHDTYTDIITFNYCDEDVISGDIFISIDRVEENAKTFNTGFENELYRVMIHGILHLIGYNDKSEQEQSIMRTKEDFYLSLLPN